MYQYTFDEDTTKKIKKETETAKDIFRQFEDVDNKYNTLTDSNTNLSLEKIDYTAPTKQQVEETAKNSLESYKNTSLGSINNTYDQKAQNIDKSIENVKKQAEAEKEKIYASYQNAKDEAKDDAIKRGLARSSIIVNTLADYDKGMFNTLSQKSEELNKTISEYQGQKNVLEEQKMNALGSFDIEYAVKLQNKIDELNESIFEKQQEVIEYNNKVSQIEAEWKKVQEDANYDKITDLADLIGTNGSAVFDTLKQNEKYVLAKKYFDGLSKDDALNQLKNNSAFLNNIGRYNYNKLLEELNTRE